MRSWVAALMWVRQKILEVGRPYCEVDTVTVYYARIIPASDGKALHRSQVLEDFHVVADSFSY